MQGIVICIAWLVYLKLDLHKILNESKKQKEYCQSCLEIAYFNALLHFNAMLGVGDWIF